MILHMVGELIVQKYIVHVLFLSCYILNFNK